MSDPFRIFWPSLVASGGGFFMWFDVVMEWMNYVTLALSLIATGIAISAEVRSRRTATREQRLSEVRFRAMRATADGDVVTVELINEGTEQVRSLRVDPASVLKVATTWQTTWLLMEPNTPFRFEYRDPKLDAGRLEAITLVWSGPGTGRQRVLIPAPESE